MGCIYLNMHVAKTLWGRTGMFRNYQHTSVPGVFRRAKSTSVLRTRSHGSPALMECWTDETANFELKAMAVASHRSVWHARLLSSWRARTEHESKRRRLA